MPRQRQTQKYPPSQKKPPLTHFLCLPLVTPSSKPQLEVSIETFRKNASPVEPEQTTNLATPIHPKAIRPVGALHCTLGVMSLDASKLQKAIDLLQTLNVERLLSDAAASTSNPSPTTRSTQPPTESEPPVAAAAAATTTPAQPHPSSPLKISLTGLASMHSPANTSILYIPPSDPTQRLYPFCLALQKLFQDEGVLLPDNRELRLHATIVNTIYAKGRKKKASPKKDGKASSADPTPQEDEDDRSQGHGPFSNAPLKFDARRLLDEYKDFVWAEGVVLDRIAICEMGAKKQFDAEGTVVDEEYTEVASVKLPVIG
jgi:activating signal cointegrator complex subunit 1